jgi:hypothetical protein
LTYKLVEYKLSGKHYRYRFHAKPIPTHEVISVSSFKQLPLSDLRVSLPKFKRQVQLGMKRIAATYYGQVVGFLVPLKDLDLADQEGAIGKSEEMSLSDFRAHMTECWERLQVDVDCIYLTYHNRRAAAFVSPRLANYLPIPISEVAHKLLAVDSGLIEVEYLLKD